MIDSIILWFAAADAFLQAEPYWRAAIVAVYFVALYLED